MDSTFIKIKFIPLIRHLQKDNTKCCLEIVPHVTSIKNLDKIEFNEKNKLIEYTVPVTYKISFKKDADKNQDKMYHSCIELRHLSSKSLLACGDVGVSKVVSHSFILSTVTDNCDKSVILTEPIIYDKRLRNTSEHFGDNSIIPIKNEDFCHKDKMTKSQAVTAETLDVTLSELNTYDKRIRDTNEKKNYEPLITINNKDIYLDKKLPKSQLVMAEVSKGTCLITKTIEQGADKYRSKILELNNMETYNFDENHVSLINHNKPITEKKIANISEIRSNEEKKRRLTMTSTCTLNTTDVPAITIVGKNAEYDSNLCVKYSRKYETDHAINELKHFVMNRHLFTQYNNSQNKSLKRVSRERILPAMRVAHFMMTVENEILPLKKMLCEIYSKCALLGLLWKSSVFRTPHPQFTNQTKSKCNRVVYSIVFED